MIEVENKKKKWENFLFHYNRKLKWYKKYKPIDQQKYALTKFAKKCNYKTLRFKDIWTVVYDENDYQTPHTHGPIGWSGILYYESDAKQPSTVFIQPWHNIKTGLTSMRSLDTQEGDMIFFPSFVMHFCPANHLKKKRKIISWDLQGVPNQK